MAFEITENFANLSSWTVAQGTTPSVSSNQLLIGNFAFVMYHSTSLANSYRQFAKFKVVDRDVDDQSFNLMFYLRLSSASTYAYELNFSMSNDQVRVFNGVATWNFDLAVGAAQTLAVNDGDWLGAEVENTGTDTVFRFWEWTSDPGERSAWGTETVTVTDNPGSAINSAVQVGIGTWNGRVTISDFSAGSSATAEGAGGVEITSGVGALTVAGQTPSPTLQWYREPATGALTAEGFAPTFIERGTRYAYPTADISAGNWLPSTGSDLFVMIDEEPASDTDYIYTNAAGACEIRLLPVTDPVSSSGYAVNYRIWSPVGGNAVVRLKQGATTIATWTHTGLPTTPTDYSQALAGAEADAITDHDDLRLEIEAT